MTENRKPTLYKFDSVQVRYRYLLMVDGYEETNWPMYYTQNTAHVIHTECCYCMGVV